MRSFIIILLVLCGLTSFEQVPFDYHRDFKAILEKTKDKTSDLYYQKLLIRFLDKDSSLTRAEVLALMIGFTEQKKYKPFKDLEKEQEIYDMNEGGDYEGALDESKIYLQTHPLSLRILKERSYSYHQLRKKDSAQFFMDQVDKIMGAMIYSGKGKTPETAIFSLGLIDGEHFINNVGMTPANKTTTSPKSKVLMYIVDALSDEGTHTNYYFILQHARDKMDEEEIGEEPVYKTIKKPKKEKKENKKEKAAKPIEDPAQTPVQTDSIPVATTDKIDDTGTEPVYNTGKKSKKESKKNKKDKTDKQVPVDEPVTKPVTDSIVKPIIDTIANPIIDSTKLAPSN